MVERARMITWAVERFARMAIIGACTRICDLPVVIVVLSVLVAGIWAGWE